MPSKLKKAIAVVKDQTSISLAMVKTSRTHHKSASSLEVAILKATTHDDSPINPHHLSDIIRIVSSNRTHASLCARSLGRRASRTRNWTVALKCLVVSLRLLQSSDPHFPKEVLLAGKSGHNLLNLSSSSFPRPFSSFLSSFASYLALRLHSPKPLLDNPSDLLHKIPVSQRLLDKALSVSVGPAARSSRLVKYALHAVVRESFGLYKDVSDGLAVVLDGFFHLEYESCVVALDACVKASSQFEDLAAFYEQCRSCGVGVASDYPDVRRIPEELIDTLKEFLKDKSSFPGTASGRRRLSLSLVEFCSSPKGRACDRDRDRDEVSDPDGGDYSGLDFFENAQETTPKEDDESSVESSEHDAAVRGWEIALLENAMQQPSSSNSNGGFGVDFLEGNSADSSLLSYPPSNQYNPFLQDAMHDPSPPVFNVGENVGLSNDDFFRTLSLDNAQPDFWVDFSDQAKGGSIADAGEVDLFANFDKGGANNYSNVFASFDDVNSAFPNAFEGGSFLANAPSDEFASFNSGYNNANAGLAPLGVDFGFEVVSNPLTAIVPANELAGKDVFSSAPTFKATPTFNVASDNDSFRPFPSVEQGNYQMGSSSTTDEQNVMKQQQNWLQIQDKILTKHWTET